MPIEPQDYSFYPSASFNGVFETVGYESNIIPIMPYSCLNISCWSDQPSTINIYTYPSHSSTGGRKTLVFSKILNASTTFFKRFAVSGMFFSLEVLNSGVEGTLELASGVSINNQFSSQTLLNTEIGITADTSLTRIANNWNSDMVRGLHEDFTKVNIQAILNQSNPNTTRTLGLQDYKFNVSSSDNLYIYAPNVNDVAGGSGARSVRIIYVDASDTIQTLDYSLVAPAGSVYPLGISGKMVHRAFVLTSGSSNSNTGQITITNSGQTVIYGSIEPTENTTHNGLYLVPASRELVVSTVNIVATGMSGILRINELDYTNSQLYSIGDFPVDTKPNNYTYDINGLIPTGNGIQIDFIPDAGTPSVKTIINVMVNGVLSPIKSSF